MGKYDGIITPRNFLGYSGSKDGKKYGQSPALTDIFLRHTGIGNVIPLDGRGFNTMSGIYYPCGNESILNASKNTDGYYLPLIQGDTITDSKINVSEFFESSIVQNQNWGSQNKTSPGFGPQGAIATFSFEYMGSALVDDPSFPGPSYNGKIGLPKDVLAPFNVNDSPDGPDPILDQDSLAFTLRGRSFTTYLYGKMNNVSLYTDAPDYLNKTFNPWYNIWEPKMTTPNEFFTSPNTATQLSSAKGERQKLPLWLYPEDSQLGKKINNTASGWASSATAIGGEANILSCIQTNGGNFTPMENFLKAAAITMGGLQYASQTKVGLYSFEFMPLSWIGGEG